MPVDVDNDHVLWYTSYKKTWTYRTSTRTMWAAWTKPSVHRYIDDYDYDADIVFSSRPVPR